MLIGDSFYPTQFILHGALILFIANLAGGLLGRSLASRKTSAETKEAWRMAHASSVSFGMFLMVVGAIFIYLKLSSFFQIMLLLSLTLSGYGFLVGTIIAAWTGHKGLRWKPPTQNYFIFICYMIGVIGSLIGIPIIIFGVL